MPRSRARDAASEFPKALKGHSTPVHDGVRSRRATRLVLLRLGVNVVQHGCYSSDYTIEKVMLRFQSVFEVAALCLGIDMICCRDQRGMLNMLITKEEEQLLSQLTLELGGGLPFRLACLVPLLLQPCRCFTRQKEFCL